MNIYINKFWKLFPEIIEYLANADYVALDLEMTGIRSPSNSKINAPSANDIYRQAKEAAQTYHVLQLGLTLIHHDDKKGTYQYRVYNFHVSPMLEDDGHGANERLATKLSRTFTVSYDTLIFLRRNRVRIEDAYIDGIPYISRAEQAKVALPFFDQQKSPNKDVISLSDQDEETKNFYGETLERVKGWDDSPEGKDKETYINISNPYGERLNRFQIRLVHQMLEDHFPGKYRAFHRCDEFVQIVNKNDKDDKKYRDKAAKSHRAALRRQTGLQYILEALVGGEFAEEACHCIPSAGDNIKSQLKRCNDKLKRKQPIIVGHNMFLDLCFLYQTFFAPLPETFEEFQEEILSLFPRIVDTKFLSSEGKQRHGMLPDESLSDYYKAAEKLSEPTLVNTTPKDFNSANTNLLHQAGFDSEMTAVVFLKKAWAMSKADAEDSENQPHKLPDWDSEFFEKFGNTLKMGNTGYVRFKGRTNKGA